MTGRGLIERHLEALPEPARRASRHGDSYSYFVADREVAHFHGDERLDARLKKERIPQLRAEGLLGGRVMTRGPSAEWVAVRVADPPDVAVRLVEEAVRAKA